MQIIEASSPNHDERREKPVDMLILHYTGMATGEAALARLRDPAAGVSSHWLIEEDGRIFSLVPESARARHAGVSYWAGTTDVNSRSIGIELVNPGHEWGYRSFPEMQMAALAELASDILRRHPIPPHRVLGHSDVAPTRKQDPGELFDWPWLASHGIGCWPSADLTMVETDPIAGLTRIGYDPDPAVGLAVRVAFQRHWCRHRLDGVLDSVTRARIASVASVMSSDSTGRKSD